ncbi:MAG: hypothetical protein HQL49_09800 [Gammaproteobacteria bacterium]|nr:hypothetical protein [Gammaproteobacteria bacterium]
MEQIKQLKYHALEIREHLDRSSMRQQQRDKDVAVVLELSKEFDPNQGEFK